MYCNGKHTVQQHITRMQTVIQHTYLTVNDRLPHGMRMAAQLAARRFSYRKLPSRSLRWMKLNFASAQYSFFWS